MPEGKRLLPGMIAITAGLGVLGFLFLLRLKSQEIELLRGEIERLNSRRDGRPAPQGPPADSSSSKLSAAEQEELLALRKQVAELKGRPATPPSPSEASPSSPAVDILDKLPKGPRDAATLKARAMNEGLPAGDRVTAFGLLRHLHPESRTIDVSLSMLRLLESSPDETLRADLCRHMRGLSTEEVKRALIARAAEDPSAKVREQAVDTLGRMAPDPLVRSTLERIRTVETNPEVQRQLKKALDVERK